MKVLRREQLVPGRQYVALIDLTRVVPGGVEKFVSEGDILIYTEDYSMTAGDLFAFKKLNGTLVVLSILFIKEFEMPNISFPITRVKGFKHIDKNQRWGQAFYNYMELYKVENQVDKDFCDKIYNAEETVARKMVAERTDYEN